MDFQLKMKTINLIKPAVIFDFGGVLLDWDPRYLFRKIFNGDEAGMEQFLAEVDFYRWKELQDAGRSFREGIEAGCQEFPQYCHLLRAYDDRWAESIRGPITGSVEVLAELKNSGFPLYGLSNWSDEKFIQAHSLYKFFAWFDQIIISGAIKLAKPDPQIFYFTLGQIGRPAGECVMIDDSLKNIEAARNLGFQAIHFRSPEQLRQELAQFEWWSSGLG